MRKRIPVCIGTAVVALSVSVPGLLGSPVGLAGRPVSATEPKREKWEYAYLHWESDDTSPTFMRITWEGPGTDPERAEGFKALAERLKLGIRRDTSTATRRWRRRGWGHDPVRRFAATAGSA